MSDLTSRRLLPDVAVGRLAGYLRELEALAGRGVDLVSSQDLADAVGVSAAQLRKDLSQLGSYGVRGVGYDVKALAAAVSEELGSSRTHAVVIVGAGHLGRALALYPGLEAAGFPVAAICDTSPDVVGTRVGGLVVTTLEALPDPLPSVGVIATPPDAAQGVVDVLVARGVASILNFAPVPLTVPADVHVRTVDVSRELAILAFHQERGEHQQLRPQEAHA